MPLASNATDSLFSGNPKLVAGRLEAFEQIIPHHHVPAHVLGKLVAVLDHLCNLGFVGGQARANLHRNLFAYACLYSISNAPVDLQHVFYVGVILRPQVGVVGDDYILDLSPASYVSKDNAAPADTC